MDSLFQDAPGLVGRTDIPRALWGQWGVLYEPAELVFPSGILVLWLKSSHDPLRGLARPHSHGSIPSLHPISLLYILRAHAVKCAVSV